MGQQVKDLAVTAAAQVAVMARVPSLAREHVVGMVKKKKNECIPICSDVKSKASYLRTS